jgi:hypothetical protein
MNTRVITVGIAIIILGTIAYYVATTRSDSAMMEGDSAMSGESMEGAVEGDSMERTAMSETKMAGTWKSNEDAKFTREFRSDGTFTDRYEGDASATMSGSWKVVDPTAVDVGVPASALAGVTVVEMNFEDGPMYFGIANVSDVELAMVNYSGRGNILVFTKMN